MMQNNFPDSVITASNIYTQHFMQTLKSVTPKHLWKRCEDAVQSPRTPYGGVYFLLAQNKRRGLAFAQRDRQRALGKLWQRCGVFLIAVGALWVRRVHDVKTPCKSCILTRVCNAFSNNISNHIMYSNIIIIMNANCTVIYVSLNWPHLELDNNLPFI